MARVNAITALTNLSRKLPALTSAITINDGSGQAINIQNGSPITFTISDNRLPNVTVDIYIQEKQQKIITDGVIMAVGGQSGGNITYLPGPNTWDQFTTNLFPTDPTNLSILPFSADFTLTWKGAVAGTPLPDGDYTLCVKVTDGDKNPPNPVCRGVTIDTTPPTVEVWDDNGKDLSAGGSTSVPGITVVGTDPIVNGVASGVDQITLTSPDGYSESFSGGGQLDAVAPFDGLAPSTYTVTVVDAAGNASATTFSIVPPPSVAVGGAGPPAAQYNQQSECGFLADIPITIAAPAGLSSVVVSTKTNHTLPTAPSVTFNQGDVSVPAILSGLCDGGYSVQVVDADGTPGELDFTLRTVQYSVDHKLDARSSQNQNIAVDSGGGALLAQSGSAGPLACNGPRPPPGGPPSICNFLQSPPTCTTACPPICADPMICAYQSYSPYFQSGTAVSLATEQGYPLLPGQTFLGFELETAGLKSYGAQRAAYWLSTQPIVLPLSPQTPVRQTFQIRTSDDSNSVDAAPLTDVGTVDGNYDADPSQGFSDFFDGASFLANPNSGALHMRLGRFVKVVETLESNSASVNMLDYNGKYDQQAPRTLTPNAGSLLMTLTGRGQILSISPTPAAPNTPTGDNVPVPVADVITVVYAHVSQTGETTAVPLGSNFDSIYPLPQGYRTFLATSSFVDLSATAVSSGSIAVGIPYSPAGLLAFQAPDVRLVWLSSGAWLDVTASLDPVVHKVTGTASGLGAFGVVLLDTSPPNAVSDLSALYASSVGVTLSWTAPGEDGGAGQAAAYDLRMAAVPITDADFGAAAPVLQRLAPRPAGSYGLHGEADFSSRA